MKIKTLTLSLIAGLLGLVLLPIVAYADSPSITLSTNVSSVTNGGTVIVDVYMDGGGQPINAVAVNLSYPTAQLQYVGLNYSGSPFNISTPGDGGGSGSVSIQNGTITPVTGSALVATITFHALVGSGSAVVNVDSSSQLISATTNSGIGFSPGSTSIAFVSAATHTSTTAASASSNSSSSSSGSTSATTTPTVAPSTTVISGVKAVDLSPSSATITWTTNNPTDSVVDFGLNTNYGLSNSLTTMTTTHSVQLSSNFLLPEITLHYRVQGTDSNGNVVTSPDRTLELPGIPITIIVYGPNGNPQPNAQVTIAGTTGTTNSKGSVTLTTGYGNENVATTYQNVTVTKPITVSSDTKPLTTYQLDLAKQPLNRWMLTSIGLIVIILLLIAADGILFSSRMFAGLINWRKPKGMLGTLAIQTSARQKPTKLSDFDDQKLTEVAANDEPPEQFYDSRREIADSSVPTADSLSGNGSQDQGLFRSSSVGRSLDVKAVPSLSIKVNNGDNTMSHPPRQPSAGHSHTKVIKVKLANK